MHGTRIKNENLTVLIYMIDTSHFFTARPGRFTFGKERQYPLNRRVFEPRSWSGHFGDMNNVLLLPGANPRTAQIVGSSLHKVGYITGRCVVSFADTVVVR